MLMRHLAALSAAAGAASCAAAAPTSGDGQFAGPVALLGGCDARAWVRAPDLVPNHILHGDVRLLLNGSHPDCAAISSAQLGLRHKEQVLLRFPAGELELPKRPERNYSRGEFDFGRADKSVFDVPDWELNSLHRKQEETEQSYIQALETWSEKMKDHTLWDVKGEETIHFDISMPVALPLAPFHGAEDAWDSINTFSIAVPPVNFAASIGTRVTHWGSSGNREDLRLYSESRIEYYMDIRFKNGTSAVLPAGLTAFVPQAHSLHTQERYSTERPLRFLKPKDDGDTDISILGLRASRLARDDDCEIITEMGNWNIKAEFDNNASVVQGSSLAFNLTLSSNASELKAVPDEVSGRFERKVHHLWAENVLKASNGSQKYQDQLWQHQQVTGDQRFIFKLEDEQAQKSCSDKRRPAWGREDDPVIIINPVEGPFADAPRAVHTWTTSGVIKASNQSMPSLDALHSRHEAFLWLQFKFIIGEGQGEEQPRNAHDLLHASIWPWSAEKKPRHGPISRKYIFPVPLRKWIKILPRNVEAQRYGYTQLFAGAEPVSFTDARALAPVFMHASARELSSDDLPLLSDVSTTRQLHGRDSEGDIVFRSYNRKACEHAPSSESEHFFDMVRCGSGDAYVGEPWLKHVHDVGTEDLESESDNDLVFQDDWY